MKVTRDNVELSRLNSGRAQLGDFEQYVLMTHVACIRLEGVLRLLQGEFVILTAVEDSPPISRAVELRPIYPDLIPHITHPRLRVGKSEAVFAWQRR